ncbi:MAG: prolyl oligopeptidase family serine peptidase [Acutalibacteraceae bacterium]
MKKIYLMLLTVIFVISFVGCGAEKNSDKESKTPITYSDIAYGEDANQNLTMVLPEKTNANGGVILLIHGGAWVEGDKYNDYTNGLINNYWQSGYITATMNYRFTSKNIVIDDMLSDIKSALNFIKKQAADNGITTTKAMLVGWSSGGHMAELYAYSRANDADIEVACVVAYSGIADITDKSLYIDNPLDDILKRPMTDVVSCLCGFEFDSNSISNAEPYLKKASPITYVDTAVPTVICHSEADTYVNYQTAVRLKEQLDLRKIDNCFIDFPTSGHDLLTDSDSLELSHKKLIEYAKKYLK